MHSFLELQFLVDDLVDFVKLSMFINTSFNLCLLFVEVDREPKHEKYPSFCQIPFISSFF